eukprot:SM000037S13496  [mRNA]  locus=s37:238975:240979:+ [translate_table: standard]
MADQEARGDELAAKADKKARGFALFAGSRFEDAADLLERAATAYKLAKASSARLLRRSSPATARPGGADGAAAAAAAAAAGDKGGETYRRLSELQLTKLDSKHEAASALVDAANCYKKGNTPAALECLQLAVEYLTDLGRLSMAAKHCKDIGELYEKEEHVENAMAWFEKAADFYQGEEATSSGNQCRLKVAQFAAQLEQYQRAVDIFEEIAQASMDSNLLKYSVKGYLLNAGLCRLCHQSGDSVSLQRMLDRYQELDATFTGTREYKFLADLTEAVGAEDIEQFTEVVREFDSMTRLDSWKTMLLLRAKKTLKDRENAEDELT